MKVLMIVLIVWVVIMALISGIILVSDLLTRGDRDQTGKYGWGEYKQAILWPLYLIKIILNIFD